MLRTNSKIARQNVRAYALKSVDFEGYDLPAAENWQQFSLQLTGIIKKELPHLIAKSHGYLTQATFAEWLQGLPFHIGDYYYNVSAVELLGDILEETQEERSRYTEEQAESLMTYLLYSEIMKGCR